MTYKRIRELREKMGFSQARVGSMINFPQRTYILKVKVPSPLSVNSILLP